MRAQVKVRGVGWVGGLIVLLLVTGCATPKIDWNSRVGSYTYEQAVLDMGPADKYTTLNDGTIVAEWMTSRGVTYASSGYGVGYWGWWGPYPAYINVYTSPDRYLRLTFGPDHRLQAWHKFYK
jgi:hypothetical protein